MVALERPILTQDHRQNLAGQLVRIFLMLYRYRVPVESALGVLYTYKWEDDGIGNNRKKH